MTGKPNGNHTGERRPQGRGRTKGVEGSVRNFERDPAKPGRWQAYFPPRILHEQGITHRLFPIEPGRTYETKQEAEAALIVAIRAYDAGELKFDDPPEPEPEPSPPQVRTISVMLTDFLDENKELVGSTKDQYQSVMRRVICNPDIGVGDLDITQVTTPQLRGWFLGLSEHDVAPSMARAAWKVLSSAFTWEVDWHGLPASPATLPKARPTKQSRVNRRRTRVQTTPLPTWEQSWVMIAGLEHKSDRLLALMMAWSGLRLAEAASMYREWLLPRDRKVLVAGTWTKASGEPWVWGATKSGEQRTPPVPLGLWDALNTYIANDWTAPTKEGRQPVLFPPTLTRAPRGGIGVYNSRLWGDCAWEPMIAVTGFPFVAYAFRAYAASTLVDAGATTLQAKELLGHAQLSTTEKYYLQADDLKSHDPERMRLRLDPSLSVPERLDRLYAAWVERFGDPLTAEAHQQVLERFGAVTEDGQGSRPRRVARDRRKKYDDKRRASKAAVKVVPARRRPTKTTPVKATAAESPGVPVSPPGGGRVRGPAHPRVLDGPVLPTSVADEG